MKTRILLLFVILPHIFLNAQNNVGYNSEVKEQATEKWEEIIKEGMSNTYSAVNFEYTPVEGLSVESASYSNSGLYSRLMRSVIRSNDKQFFSVIEVTPSPLTFSVYTKDMRSIYYANKIAGHFLDIAWEYDESWRDKISIKDLMENMPVEYAEEIFDSDTVVRYSLLLKNFLAKDGIKYTECDVLIKYNNDLCPVFFYCFYTDEGYENRKIYMENLEKSVHFKNGFFRRTIRELRQEELDELNLSLSKKRLMPDLSWESVLDAMNLAYDSTAGLQLNRKFEFCKPYSLSLYNSLKSGDDNFIVYMEHYFTGMAPPLFTCDENCPDTVVSAYNRYFNNLMNHYSGTKNDYLTRISKDKRNIRHFYIIRDHLIDIAEKYNKEYRDQFSMTDLKKHVYYFPDSYAQTEFNADTVLIYTLPVKPVNGNKAFSRKYSRCEVLVIQKKDIGPVFFYCFYTGKGYKKRDNYMEKLGKTIKFKD